MIKFHETSAPKLRNSREDRAAGNVNIVTADRTQGLQTQEDRAIRLDDGMSRDNKRRIRAQRGRETDGGRENIVYGAEPVVLQR